MSEFEWRPEWPEVRDDNFALEVEGESKQPVFVAFLPEPWPDDFDNPGDAEYLSKRRLWFAGLTERFPSIKFRWFLADHADDDSTHARIGIEVLPSYVISLPSFEAWAPGDDRPALAIRAAEDWLRCPCQNCESKASRRETAALQAQAELPERARAQRPRLTLQRAFAETLKPRAAAGLAAAAASVAYPDAIQEAEDVLHVIEPERVWHALREQVSGWLGLARTCSRGSHEDIPPPSRHSLRPVHGCVHPTLRGGGGNAPHVRARDWRRRPTRDRLTESHEAEPPERGRGPRSLQDRGLEGAARAVFGRVDPPLPCLAKQDVDPPLRAATPPRQDLHPGATLG